MASLKKKVRTAVRTLPYLVALVTWSCTDVSNPAAPEVFEKPGTAGVNAGNGRKVDVVVTLAEGEQPGRVAAKHRVKPGRVFRNSTNGFATTTTVAARDRLLRDGRVLRVEDDEVVSVTSEPQWDASWNLDRVDQRANQLDGAYAFNSTGAGVTAYLVDSGIRYSHQEFGGRASFGFDVYDGDGSDCHGHGTHVAGILGGLTYGVAKGVNLVSVRVLGCNASGFTSGVLAGLDWVAANATIPSVVNLSLKTRPSDAVDEAVARLTAMGINVVAAAGNDDANACGISPARAASAMTVGASLWTDERATFSNWGSCVDLFAPGLSIPSASHSDDVGEVYMHGTSMAAPHVAGAAALYLSGSPSATTSEVTGAIVGSATQGVVASARSANNHLLYTFEFNGESGGGGDPPPNAPPTADFTSSCEQSGCDFADRSSDPDGSVVRWQWDFGDGTESSTMWSNGSTAHEYAQGGTYAVRLTVTDDRGADNSSTSSVTVESPPPPPQALVLEANGSKWKGTHVIDLFWSGASGGSVEILLNGAVAYTVENSGVHTHATSNKGKGSYLFQVCEVGGGACSNEVSVRF